MAVLPRVGDTFGRYRIDSEIGRGGMGVVLGATDTTIGRTVALKVVSPGLGGSAEFQQRFEREAAVLARLDSPHVIAIYDFGTEASCPYIATQYIAGGDLGALVAARGPMPPRLALQVCAQVAEALGDAHRAGVVHRDVKPANVLVRDADAASLHAYLCDFGIARSGTDGLTQAGAVAGTWSYLSPECGQGAPATPSSDLYALGCLLWALLTGAPPYRGSDVEVAVAHQRAPHPRLPGADELSIRLNRVLDLTLAKDPRERYADAEAARRDLLVAAAAGGISGTGGTGSGLIPLPGPYPPHGSSPGHLSLGPLPPRSGPTTTTGARPGRRRTTVVAALAAAAVLAVTAGVVAATALAGDDSTPVAGPSIPTGPGASATDEAPTDGPTDGPSTPDAPAAPAPPTRLDQGGPITGDLDGDGLGDLRVRFFHTIRTKKTGDGAADDGLASVVDTATWSSDGTRFVDERTERAPDDSSGRLLTGDFDGDGEPERLTVEQTSEGGPRLRLRGPLSGGERIDDDVATGDGAAFLAVTDLDGDDADDLVLQYYTDYEEPSRFTGIVVDGLRLRPERTLLATGPSPAVGKFEVGDFDGDGRGDLAVIQDAGDGRAIGSYRSTLTVWLGTGTGARRGPSTTFVGGYRPELIAADVDGDEVDEVVVLQDGALAISEVADGSLSRPRPVGSLMGAKPVVAFVASDVDGNGLDDVVVVQQLGDDTARLQAAVTVDGRFVTTGWGRWEGDFVTSRYFYRFAADGRSFE